MNFTSKDVFYWLKDGEGQRLDYKHAITSPQKIAKTLVAFGNSRGGVLLIGIDDNKDIIGVKEEQEKFQLLQAANKFCFPKIDLNFKVVFINSKKVLVVNIEESKTKPHYWISKNEKKVIYIRSKDQCIVPNPLIINSLENGSLTNAIVNNKAYHKVKEEVITQFISKEKLSIKEYAQLNNLEEYQAQKRLLNLVLEGVLIDDENEIFSIV